MKKIDFGTNESFIQNYQKLKSARKMGEYYHCNKDSVTKHARDIGYDYSKNKENKITDSPQDVYNLYLQLQSTNKVAQKYNCSSTAVLNFLKKNGYSTQDFTGIVNKIPDDEFCKKYNELKTAQKMAEYYGCSSTAILNKAKKIGYNVNSSKEYKLSEEDKKNIIASYNTMTSGELAKKYNVSRGMITKIWYDNHLSGKIVENPSTTEKDITGQKFGKWTVLYKTNKRNAGGIIYWHCRCECGVERDVLGSSLRNGYSLSCGLHPNISKGNYKIAELLRAANIPFESEKTFSTCKDKKELPFDFYVNNQYLIEYDGFQHFEESREKTQEIGLGFDYDYTHKHDLMKNQWCKENGIPLIRIPYIHYDNLTIEDLKLETTTYLIK